MATAAQWVAGARPRTLPAAVAPVVAGTGAAAAVDAASLPLALLALLVALGLQVGANYANDYADGIRGTDAQRVGPVRLTGSGAARPDAVRAAALAAFAVGAAAGLLLVAVTGAFALLVLGAVCIAAAWAYTGGARPYGYRGLGEVAVFVFFGLVAVLGTTYVQAGRVTAEAVVAAVGVGAYAAAILVANNLRDIRTDASAGKRTLAVVLGDRRTRVLWLALVGAAHLVGLALLPAHPGVVLSLGGVPFALRAAVAVASGQRGTALVPVLRDTGLGELGYAVGLGLGLAL